MGKGGETLSSYKRYREVSLLSATSAMQGLLEDRPNTLVYYNCCLATTFCCMHKLSAPTTPECRKEWIKELLIKPRVEFLLQPFRSNSVKINLIGNTTLSVSLKNS